jgi:hypothetical protein
MMTYNTLASFGKPKDKPGFPTVYTLYRRGMTTTLKSRQEAIALLKTGEWFDRTTYETKEEVIQHEEISKCSGSKTCASSEREEPGHEQHQSDPCDSSGKELDTKALRSGSSSGVLVKKRGRPKRVNK